MKTLFATTTALAMAAAAPALAGDGYMKGKSKMDKAQMTTTQMDAKMNSKMDGTMQSASMSSGSDVFGQIDVDGSGDVDFTEFSNYMEARGYSAADSAKEYVKLVGTDNVITDRSFAGMDIANLPHKHLDDGTKHNMNGMRSGGTQSASTTTFNQQTAVMGSTMFNSSYGSFADYDMNADGRVDFNEYRQYRTKAGITTTAAAQEFIRFSDGQSYFDESRFMVAASDDVLNRGYFRAQPRM